MIIYVSGKYSAPTRDGIEKNIQSARRGAIAVWEKGHTALCPHLNTQHFDDDCKCGYDDYIHGDLEMVTRCDAIFMLPGWQESKGAVRELAFARKCEIAEFYSLDEIETIERRKYDDQ